MNGLKRKMWSIIRILILTVVAVAVLIPVFFMMSTSMNPGTNIVNPDITLSNSSIKAYEDVFRSTPIVRWFFNSIYISTIKTVLQVLLAVLAAFAFTRFDFYGKKLLFYFILAMMLLPPQTLFLPLYFTTDLFGWVDTYTGAIIPQLASAFIIFMLRQAFMKIPQALVEASELDGCGPMRSLIHVYFPISKPSITAMIIIGFCTNWNDYNWTLLVLKDKLKYTMPVAISYFQDTLNIQIPQTMAVAVLTTFPLLIIYLFAQKQFIDGFAHSGIK
jgi:ABC-type glycerol-3-phosphate transport system permease component